jgi:hypothetical protein
VTFNFPLLMLAMLAYFPVSYVVASDFPAAAATLSVTLQIQN